MLKKFLIVCTCVCLILCLFNISGAFTYDVVYEALNDVGDHSGFIQENFTKLGIITHAIPDYFGLSTDRMMAVLKEDISATQTYNIRYLYIQKLNDNEILNDKYSKNDCIIFNTTDSGSTIVDHDRCPTTDTYVVLKDITYTFNSAEKRDEVFNLVEPFCIAPHRQEHGFGVFDAITDAINSILYVVLVLFLLVEITINVVFGFIAIVWDLLRAAFRIIGFI